MLSRQFVALLAFVSLTSVSCSSTRKAQTPAHKPVETSLPAMNASQPARDMATSSPTAPPPAAHPPAHEPVHDSGHPPVLHKISTEQAQTYLQNGNIRFMTERLRNLKGQQARSRGRNESDVQRLYRGQEPHAIVLSCSDSRVPPEIVFDQKLGEIFVIRTAGQALGASVIASIEYAVEHFGSRLIVVMGHTKCGAVKAAVDTINGGNAGSNALNDLVADIHPRIRSSLNGTKADQESESLANVRGVIEDLRKRSPILANRLDKEQLEIRPALYHMDNGQVTWGDH